MELKVIEQTDKTFVFEIVGEDHTFCNALKDELAQDEDVKFTSYKIEHPLIGIPKFFVEMKKGDAKKALAGAAKRLKKNLEKVQDQF
ncbi:DNA-directed RNA polymerase subunit L [Candidatus Woesearchaeota archaeon]|nr:DNA-directed RNA polymerase subunit L [Candidatus Woesearchaeota archaeon]